MEGILSAQAIPWIFLAVSLVGAAFTLSALLRGRKLCWGFNADYNLVPDLPVFIKAIENSFAALSESAGLRGLPPEV